MYKSPVNLPQMSVKKNESSQVKKEIAKNRFKLKNNEVFGNLFNEAVSEVQHQKKKII